MKNLIVMSLVLLFSSPTYGTFASRIGMTQVQGANFDPISQFSLGGSYQPTKATTLALTQSMTKNYFIDSATDEWNIEDTSLSASILFNHKRRTHRFAVAAALSLPVSRQSQYDEKYTSLSTRGNYYFAPRKWLRYTFGVGIDGHMSRYQTTPNDEGSGGRVLPKYGYLATQAGRISFKYWNIGYSYSFRQTYYYQLDDESSNPPNQNLPDQSYQVSASAGLTFGSFDTSLGYSQGRRLELAGVADYVIFDEDQSTGFVSMGYSF